VGGNLGGGRGGGGGRSSSKKFLSTGRHIPEDDNLHRCWVKTSPIIRPWFYVTI